QGVQAYLAPPIFVVFFFGIFNKRLNKYGCMAALIVGFALGLFRLAVDTPAALIDGFAYDEGSFLWIVHHTIFLLSSLSILSVSILYTYVTSHLQVTHANTPTSGH